MTEAEASSSANSKFKSGVNRNARLIVRNISFKATEDDLRKHFAEYGTLEEVKLLRRPDGKLVGCGFVHYKHVPMAKKALAATNQKPFLGRPVSVDWAVAKDKYMRHIVNKQIEMEDDVKKEESDSDDEGPPLNISSVKEEIIEEEESTKGKSKKAVEKDLLKVETDEEDSDSGDDNDDGDDDDDDEEEDESSDEAEDDVESQDGPPAAKRVKLNDAEDGCTVFLTNIPFSVDNDQLRQFAERTAPVAYALVCVDRMTEHSKGSGFIKFTNTEDADKFLALPPDQMRLEGQTLVAKPALKRESLVKGGAKQPKDNRSLYLVKEGVVVAGTKAAVGVSASDMAKRLALERSKTQMLKNLNRFVSRYRLVVSNLPPSCNDARLRRICAAAAGRGAGVTEARVMRDLRAPVAPDGQHPSKGYGFVMFTRHEDALACLRKLNNNPDIFDKNNRPIVSFSIEDRTALNARKKRLEKSIANNPQSKEFANNNNYSNDTGKFARFKNKNQNNDRGKFDNFKNNTENGNGGKFGRFKNKNENNDRGKFGGFKNKNDNNDREKFGGFKNRNESNDRGKFGGFKNKNENENHEVGKFVRRPKDDDMEEYTGLTAKEGAQHKMRSSHKLRTQADVHRQNVKLEKKKSKRAMRLKMAARERVKQPKQKINKTPGKNKRKKFKSNDIRDILK